MIQPHRTLKRISFSLAVLALFVYGCRSVEIPSRWKDRDITIDGHDTEWDGARYLVDQRDITVGAINDGSYLYLRLSTWNPYIKRQMQEAGFTVWFAPGGDSSHRIGIQYPLARTVTRSGNEDGIATPDSTAVDTLLVVLGPGKKARHLFTLDEAAANDVRVMTGSDDEHLIWEGRIPLVEGSGRPFAVGESMPSTVEVTCETGMLPLEEIDKMLEAERSGVATATGPPSQRREPFEPMAVTADFDITLKIPLAPAP